MENEDVYSVKKTRITKIEDDSLFQKWNLSPVKDVPVDDLRCIMKLFFDRASVNMGKEAYDAPESAIEAIMDFIYKDYGVLPVLHIGSAIMRGSLGKFGAGRLVPQTVYKWVHEGMMEYDKMVRHEKLSHSDTSNRIDLGKYPAGSAINKKIEWFKDGNYDMADWERVPLKELAERLGQGLPVTPDIWGVKSRKK